MMYYLFVMLLVLHCSIMIDRSYGHGFLADPPARSSAWLNDIRFRNCCSYFDHNQMFCGGANHQWKVMGGKCSICGEAYDAKPKLFGRGDSMYLGVIVKTYQQGSIIPVTVMLTANHRGVFEFRLCNIDDFGDQDATQECLDLNILKLTDSSTQFQVQSNDSIVQLNLVLPQNFTCKHCVFQWKYVTGNSWGTANGRSCLGCGRENEEFYGCADIAILDQIPSTTTRTTGTSSRRTSSLSSILSSRSSTARTTSSSSPSRTCKAIGTFSSSFNLAPIMDQYCQTICSNDCATERRLNDRARLNQCQDTCANLCVCQ